MITDGQVHDVPGSLSALGLDAPLHGLDSPPPPPGGSPPPPGEGGGAPPPPESRRRGRVRPPYRTWCAGPPLRHLFGEDQEIGSTFASARMAPRVLSGPVAVTVAGQWRDARGPKPLYPARKSSFLISTCRAAGKREHCRIFPSRLWTARSNLTANNQAVTSDRGHSRKNLRVLLVSGAARMPVKRAGATCSNPTPRWGPGAFHHSAPSGKNRTARRSPSSRSDRIPVRRAVCSKMIDEFDLIIVDRLPEPLGLLPVSSYYGFTSPAVCRRRRPRFWSLGRARDSARHWICSPLTPPWAGRFPHCTHRVRSPVPRYL